MGRIKKAAGPKHEATVSQAVSHFVSEGITSHISDLPAHLRSFPQGWPFPRGDLYHWIPLLNRFDAILEAFIKKYGLNNGPQTRPFGCSILRDSFSFFNEYMSNKTARSEADLEAAGFGPEGDREVVEAILKHSQILLENCGNRSLYNSSDRLDDLLNTTSLSLLSTTLQLSVRLAQRYHTSRQRMSSSSQHVNHVLLASHYNIDLEKVQKLANPMVAPAASSLSSASEDPNNLTQEATSSNNAPRAANANDLLSFIKAASSEPNGAHKSSVSETKDWASWANVHLTYYQPSTDTKGESKPPTTPTPIRRTSGASGLSRLSNLGDANDTATTSSLSRSDESSTGPMKHIEISPEAIASSSAEDVLKEHISSLPKESAYDLLTRVRTASAVMSSASERQQIVGVRLLAITNLAYIYPDSVFQTRILQPDSEEPRRLQLVHQLTSLLNPPGNGESGVSAKTQTIALNTLEAISKHKSKEADVCAALSINVNHGVLFYVLRKAVAELAVDNEVQDPEIEDRREAVFSLIEDLPKPSTNRVGETLVAAGLLEILIEALTLRTKTAELTFPKILAILPKVIFASRDGLQTFANVKGLDAISDLIAHEVQSSLENAQKGEGLPKKFRNKLIDYEIPFHQRETLTKLFRNISNMMQNSSGNFERLLRNFIDSIPLLTGLRIAITNGSIFGAAIWSGAVNIMSSFIHNEPTSYAIISESGLSKSFIEAISGCAVKTVEEGTNDQNDSNDNADASDRTAPVDGNAGTHTSGVTNQQTPKVEESGKPTKVDRDPNSVMAEGILPHVEAIIAIPQAFGAICLNHSGMELFLASSALDKFFEVFESLEHVKALNNNAAEYDTSRVLGNAFDELVRHHPNLRKPVLASVMTMIDRVVIAVENRGKSGCGAKLWVKGKNGEAVPAGNQTAGVEAINGHDEDVVMEDANPSATASIVDPSYPQTLTDDDKEGPNISLMIEVAMRFLAGLFENTGICTSFVEKHGAEKLLDLATLPCLPYDFNNQNASQELAKVVHMLMEQKPHLVLPDLLRRAMETSESLRALYQYKGTEGFFQEFISPEQQQANSMASFGSSLAVSLVNVQTLCNILYEVFSPPILHQARSSQTPFSQVNLADIYLKLVYRLGRLHRACVWEEVLLQGRLPESWKEATRIKGYGMGSEEADEVFGFINHDPEAIEERWGTTNNTTSGGSNRAGSEATADSPESSSMPKDEDTAQFKNVRTLRYLLSQIPSCIIPFLQGLGKALANKRRPETYLRQSAHLVSESISSAMLDQLKYEAPHKTKSAKERIAYWIVILTSITQLIVEGSVERPHSQVLTLILQSFKNAGGLDAMREILNAFCDEIKLASQTTAQNEKAAQLSAAYSGIKIILNFYTTIITAKSITESTQSQAITTSDRDVGHAYFFSGPQFLVELRLAVLPDLSRLWESAFADTASTAIVKHVIEILTTILESAEEMGAFTRAGKISPRRKPTQKTYPLGPEKLQFLSNKGLEKELASEALYRCMNDQNAALEYCQHAWLRPLSLPIPEYDKEKPRRPTNPAPQQAEGSTPSTEVGNTTQPNTSIGRPEAADQDTSDAADGLFLLARGGHDAIPSTANNTNSAADGEGEGAQDRPMAPPPAPSAPEDEEHSTERTRIIEDFGNVMNLAPEAVAQAQSILESHLVTHHGRSTGPSPSGSRVTSRANGSGTPVEASKGVPQVTVDDLNDERSKIKANLVERVLDVLNIHENITFELAALISAAAMKDVEDTSIRAEIGETLVQALISFSPATGNEDFRESGKKIAAYAHLLGIVLQEEKFFQATLESLKENMEHLINFIKIFPEQGSDQQSPWIAPILLVLEKLLAEDAQPNAITWKPPPPDQPIEIDVETVHNAEAVVSVALKTQLFDSILDIMPRIGKDEALVISIVRILVILTRCRKIANKSSDKRNIQRLFVMIKQLSGMTNEMLPGSFMMLLRHIVEDDDTIRQIMRSELVNNFEMRSNRPMDILGYIRQMQHLIIRSPELFVEVTNEKCEISKYESSQPGTQVITLKADPKKTESPEIDNAATTNGESSNKDALTEPAKTQNLPSCEEQKGKAPETKAPVVEHPSGVVHYLLTELLAYKDVDDKETIAPAKAVEKANEGKPSHPGVGASLTSNGPTNGAPSESSGEASEERKIEKSEFKIDQYPIYIYRCFILQCLTELLCSYNRIKIEFINFSRKADPKAMTPSKPRSGVLSYLLNDVIPIGNLNHEDSNTHRKRHNTSNWAISVIVSLCLRTNEAGYDKKPGSVAEDDQHDLLFVRKFVLEHALKAYKDASAMEEHPDIKYARILDIADLFQRLLTGKVTTTNANTNQTTEYGMQHSIAKLMYEKNFIAALTNSIADIDLNYPGSKRAVKYILRPLKQLTATAIKLSQESLISVTPGTADEDEISTASSVSDVGGGREETPDLFRNSTLNMYEPGRDEDSQSDSSEEEDDEMYDDEEEEVEGMEYEDEMERDPDEVVSDEEDVEGMGPMEGLHGEPGMDLEGDLDEDVDEDNEDEDDDDEDPEDSEDDMDADDTVEVIDEMGEDDENGEGDEVDWEDDMEEGEEVEDGEEFELGGDDAENGAESAVREMSAVRDMMLQEFGGGGGAVRAGSVFPGLEANIQALEGGLPLEGGAADLQVDIESGRYMEDVVRRPEDEEEEDDEEEQNVDEDEEEEALYHPNYDDDERNIQDAPTWGFDPDDDPFMNEMLQRHHHHHHHRQMPRRFQDSWTGPFPGAIRPTGAGMPLYRSHRPLGNHGGAANDDGANPLLRRNENDSAGSARGNRSGISDAAASLSDYWVHGMEMGGAPRNGQGESPVSFVNSIIAAIGNGTTTIPQIGGNAPIHIQFGGGPFTGRGAIASQRDLPREIQTLLGARHMHHHESTRLSHSDHSNHAVILPQPTFRRWQEESRLLFSTSVNEKALRVHNSIMRLLVPPALERRRLELETIKRIQERQEKQREEERQAKEKAEKEEQEKREIEKREAEERAEQEAREAAARAHDNPENAPTHAASEAANAGEGSEEGAMEGVESTHPEVPASAADEGGTNENEIAEEGSSQPVERIMTRLGDREIDITGLGIDLAYLDALPEDIRQEVLMSQIAIQRSQAAEEGQPPTEISGEFLEALPPEIREELLQHEAADRRRRERQEAQRQAAAAGGNGPRAEDMDPASFLASLDPTLRQNVLMEQDEDMLAHLPAEIAAEARALGGERAMHRFAGMPGRGHRGLARHLLDAPREVRHTRSPTKKPQKKPIVQMLDKAGVASLLRLMFIPQQGSSRDSFNSVLRNISENRQNRSEVISLLLSILQDGSVDVNAVERSFSQLSVRAKQPKDQKTPQPLKRTPTGAIAAIASSVEATPLTIIQQCLSTLVALTSHNPHVPSFFLTEHDLSSVIKTKSSRKGKGKETKAQRYPLNALLRLIDRKLIMESSGCLEQLANLLQSVTQPLNILLRKEKEEEKPKESSAESSTAPGNNAAIIEDVTEQPDQNVQPTTEGTTASPMDGVQSTSPTDQLNNTQPAAETSNETTDEIKADGPEKTNDKPKDEDKEAKKPRALSPPIVPEENLRLVVNIIAARECSKRTFQQSVQTISNLKAIPGAKEVFGKGLIEQAQDLGQSILEDLDELLPQIEAAQSGTDIQGLALTKFATASSDQSKLLRVLTALDYLFGLKNTSSKSAADKDKENEARTDYDLLTSLYENSTFGPLWEKLSECLSAVREGEGMLNIASILQPLIEALMVVCKNTTLKDSPLVKAQKEFAITSPPPESRMESLFFKFTEEHRKILNELVRHSPRLMMGTFSLLVKNPKVLEFDNKRSYFTKRLHSRGTEARHPQPPLSLRVRRDHVFLDSFKFLSFKTGDEIKYGKLSIRFHGEEGVDAGGVTREWFQVLSRQMFNADYALFIPVASDRTTFHPNKLSKVNEEHLHFFKFIGRIIGKALYEGRALDCHFSRAVYKRILGKTVSIKDMETLDLDYYKSLLWMLENDITDLITETFSVETDDFGVTEIVDLIENGRNIPVTEENKAEYVQLVVEYRLTGSVHTQLVEFLKGFHDIVSPELISIFNEQELELLISGLPDIDVDDWKNHTEYHNYQAASPQIQWFWRAVRSFDKEERAKLLQFVTGTSKVPLNGFGELEGMNGFSRFNIHRDYGNKDRLPSSHTCFNQLDLPEYESYEALRSHVHTAITAGSEYFGFA